MDLLTWNNALFARLRDDADPRRLVHLYLDGDVLADSSGIKEPSEAVEDFAAAFVGASSKRPFARSLTQARTWVRTGCKGDPPMVAALGMTVLAVTEEPLGGSNNVYRRQNVLLGLPEDGGAPLGYAEDVPALWRIWNGWLETEGSWLGRPSAIEDEHFVYQGWARSQGLIRTRDRLLMAEYFSEVRPDQIVGLRPDAQVREFISWLTYRGARGAHLRVRLQDDSACQILSMVLEDELERWSQGKRRRQPGRRAALPALLFYDEWEDAFDLAFEVDSLTGELEVDLGSGLESLSADESIRVLTTGASRDTLLGNDPYKWELREGLVLQTRPKEVHVFREDPQLGGRIEVRGDAAAEKYYVLARDAMSEKVATALGIPPSSTEPRQLNGWTWFESLALGTASSELRAMGLGALVRPRSSTMTLVGGRRLAGRTYLDGGAPDVFVPVDHDVRLDGEALADSTGAPVGLPGLALGSHLLEDRTAGNTMRFEVVSPSRARACGADRVWPPENASRGTGTPGLAVSGAAVSGFSGGTPALVAEVRSGDRVLVVDEQGGVFEVSPLRERWLVRAEIESHLIDIYRTVRTMSPRPAFVLVCSSRKRVTAVEIPHDGDLTPGTVTRTPVPNLRHLLYVSWKWIGTPADARRNSVVSGLIQLGASQARVKSSKPPTVSAIRCRSDVVDDSVDGNPYDSILEWLSELEHPSVGIDRFVETWRWTCTRSGREAMAGSWRSALTTLRVLGHVERDFDQRTVCLAQPTLALLPSSAGLRVYLGARPRVVLGWLDEPDEAPAAVGDILMNLVTSAKTQVHAETRSPAGPTVLYVAPSPGESANVGAVMQELGILTPDRPSSTALLHASTGVKEIQHSGRIFEIPPARQGQAWRRSHELGGKGTWVPCQSDSGRGFYRYVTSSRRTVYAWREGLGDALVELPERNWGFWFDQRAAGRRDRVRFNVGRRLLFVRKGVPLPHILERALVLRTGLLPVRIPLRNVDYDVFENVDQAAAEQVAALLGQELQDTDQEEDA